MAMRRFRACAPSVQPRGPVVLNRDHWMAQGLIYSAYVSALDVGRAPHNYVRASSGTIKGTSRSNSQMASGAFVHAQAYNGTSADSATEPTLTLSPFTQIFLTFWLWVDAYANDDKACMIYGTTPASQTGFFVTPNSASGSFLASTFRSNTFSRKRFLRPTAAAWHHYAFAFDLTQASDQFGVCYVDGISQVLTSVTASQAAGGTFGDLTLFLMSDGGSNFYAGRMANIAIYRNPLADGSVLAPALYRQPWAMFNEPDPLRVYWASAAAGAGGASGSRNWFLMS